MSTTPTDSRRAGIRLESLMIERATAEHVPYLRSLKEAVMVGRYRPTTDEAGFEQWRDRYCTNAYFEQLISSPDSMLLCIGSLREPVGMVVLHRRDDHLEIDDLLCLHPGRGDGSRLLKSCLRYAEAWRSRKVVIDIYPGHSVAEGFLTSHGFSHANGSSNDLGQPMHRYERSVD